MLNWHGIGQCLPTGDVFQENTKKKYLLLSINVQSIFQCTFSGVIIPSSTWSSKQVVVPCALRGSESAGICSNTPCSEWHFPTPRLDLYKHLPLITGTHLSFASQHHFSNTFIWISSHLCFSKNSYYRDSFPHFLFSFLLFQKFQMPTKKKCRFNTSCTDMLPRTKALEKLWKARTSQSNEEWKIPNTTKLRGWANPHISFRNSTTSKAMFEEGRYNPGTSTLCDYLPLLWACIISW